METGVGQPGVGESKVGVRSNRLLEQRYGLLIGVLVVSVTQDVPPLQVKVIGLDVFRGVGADAGLLFVGQLEGKGGSQRAVDLVFEGEQVARGTGEIGRAHV